MKRLVCFVILAGLVVTNTADADAPYRKGNRALSFTFNSLTLGDFNGGFGGKYWMSDRWALMGSVDISYRQSDSNHSTGNTIP